MKMPVRSIAGLSLLFGALAVQAQTVVTDAWVRGTVAQQKATGLFARIKSVAGGRLVAVSSPAAGVAQIHEMAMDGDMMRMREVPAVELPAGQVVELKPGGYHVMLLDLKQPLKDGEKVSVTLVVEGADGKRQNVEVMAPVMPLGAPVPHGKH